MLKAIFFDLDGTLLNSKREITPRTFAALKKCKDRGIKLFVATARPPLLDRIIVRSIREKNQVIILLFDFYYAFTLY